jgi:hypothetical protein
MRSSALPAGVDPVRNPDAGAFRGRCVLVDGRVVASLSTKHLIEQPMPTLSGVVSASAMDGGDG